MTVTTTTVTQGGNEILGTKDKKLCYLILTNSKGNKKVINVGEKTIEDVKKLLLEEDEKPISNNNKTR